MFLPQVLTAITMSLLGVGLAHRISAKRVLLIGLAANIISMVVLVVSTGFESDLGAMRGGSSADYLYTHVQLSYHLDGGSSR
jgi:F0F1-type ATP synthase assembly protein I